MALLSAHLLESGDHGRLGFHPGCPVCREERLFGVMEADAVVSRRTRAALASGLLALSTAGAPAGAIAQEGDQQTEGVAAPADPGSSSSDDLALDPGAESALPGEAAPSAPPTTGTPAAPTDGTDPQDAAPLESEPVQDPGAELVSPSQPPPQDLSTQPDSTVEPEPNFGQEAGMPPVVPAPAPSPAETVPAPPDGSQVPPDAEQAPSLPSEDPIPPVPGGSGGSSGPSHTREPDASRPEQPSAHPPSGAPVPLAPSSGTAAVAAVGVPAAQVIDSPSESDLPSLRGNRSHVVQPGDSLWSIAKRMLGSGASTARLAREVDRLWTLNADRIGTGDPDLIMVGTKLRLR